MQASNDVLIWLVSKERQTFVQTLILVSSSLKISGPFLEFMNSIECHQCEGFVQLLNCSALEWYWEAHFYLNTIPKTDHLGEGIFTSKKEYCMTTLWFPLCGVSVVFWERFDKKNHWKCRGPSFTPPGFTQLLLNHGLLNDGVRQVFSSLHWGNFVQQRQKPKIVQLFLWSLVKCLTEIQGVVYVLGFLLIQSSFDMEVLHITPIYDFLFCLCSRTALKWIKIGAEVLNFSILAICGSLVC